MFTQASIKEHILKIEESSSFDEQIYKIIEVYMDLFPVKNAFLLRYSPIGNIGEGIIAITEKGISFIRDLRDDIQSLPFISNAIHEKNAKYYTGSDLYFNQPSSKYIFSSDVKALLVVPICSGTTVIGYICTSQFEKNSIFDDKMLSSLTLFGKLVGNIFNTSIYRRNTKILSNRELEVMKRISDGQLTKEVAKSMNISELTVQQYTKSSLKKLGTQNRTHAVAELLRKGIIS